jgi:hypothetical protein
MKKNSNQFELKTKTGNIWENKDKIEDLKTNICNARKIK